MFPACGQTPEPLPVRLDFVPGELRRARRYLATLAAAIMSASTMMIHPSSRAVAADIVRVMLSDDAVPRATEPDVAPTGGTATGVMAGRVPTPLAGLITADGLTTAGVGSVDPTVGGGAAAGTVLAEATGVVAAGVVAAGVVAAGVVAAGVVAACVVAAGVVAAAVVPLTVTVPLAVGSAVMAGLVAAAAAAVRVTDVTEVALEATWICACIWNTDGVTGVAISPIVHVADPSPPGQRLVNTGSSPCGAPVTVTETPGAGPFSAETCTMKEAVWPSLMLDSLAWTLTHSSTEGLGAGVVSEGSGSHWGLAAPSAAAGVLSADAAGIPGPAISTLPARQPPTTRQAPGARTHGSRISARPPSCAESTAGQRPRRCI